MMLDGSLKLQLTEGWGKGLVELQRPGELAAAPARELNCVFSARPPVLMKYMKSGSLNRSQMTKSCFASPYDQHPQHLHITSSSA